MQFNSPGEKNYNATVGIEDSAHENIAQENPSTSSNQGAVRKETKKQKYMVLEYTTRQGDVVPSKVFKKIQGVCCHKKCNFNIKEQVKLQHFIDYYALGKYRIDEQFLMDGIKIKEKILARRAEVKIKIEAKKCAPASGILPINGSGMLEPYNKMDTEMEEALTHMKSFPAYESHYSRNRTQNTCLGSELSVNKMYELYCEKCLQEGKMPISYSVYYFVFQATGLRFKKPHTDTCRTCDVLETKLRFLQGEALQKLDEQREQHRLMYESAYRVKDKDKQK
ncbi:hypothetical protein PR048_012463 [Dryococelus australis]|uniref:Uncharacterized protein n=1 Tax=Dryococelus australis TaxID=614101 RepID=A0ABQ9HQ49_9NEOP|nr:hypothetical protein PR048_012463 [Dryococelus australis]